MDDIIILSNNKAYLHELRKEIEEYWQTILDLEMKRNWQVYPVRDRGIDFVGFRMFGDQDDYIIHISPVVSNSFYFLNPMVKPTQVEIAAIL